jgi:hypothetical protein
LGSGVQGQSKAKSRLFCLQDYGTLSKKIKIVKDEKHGQQNIDNHSGQNYNVEHFCIGTHGIFLFYESNNS